MNQHWSGVKKMIDEKKLIEDLKRLFSNYELDLPYQDSLEILNRTIEALEQPKADWIPCEERLPENDTNVIACFSCGTVTELRYLGNGIFQGIYEYNTKVIVAWQPLPQPYKKEGDSDAT